MTSVRSSRRLHHGPCAAQLCLSDMQKIGSSLSLTIGFRKWSGSQHMRIMFNSEAQQGNSAKLLHLMKISQKGRCRRVEAQGSYSGRTRMRDSEMAN